jgi:hypothetical protein
VITILDHRGCSARQNQEYKGPKSGDQDDEMCVKVQSKDIEANPSSFIQETISFRAKGIDGPYTANKFN